MYLAHMPYRCVRVVCAERPNGLEGAGEDVDGSIAGAEEEVFRASAEGCYVVLVFREYVRICGRIERDWGDQAYVGEDVGAIGFR